MERIATLELEKAAGTSDAKAVGPQVDETKKALAPNTLKDCVGKRITERAMQCVRTARRPRKSSTIASNEASGSGRRAGRRGAPSSRCSWPAGCNKPPTHDECDALLDHYVELLVSSDRPGTSAADLHKLKLQAREKAKLDPEFAACSERVSRHALECALSAPNADLLEQCLL